MYAHERSLVEKLRKQPFALVGVNSDTAERYLKTVETQDISWRSFHDGGSTGGPIATEWGVVSWPAVYVMDHEGVIRFKNVRGSALDAAVAQLLKDVPKVDSQSAPERTAGDAESAPQAVSEDE